MNALHLEASETPREEEPEEGFASLLLLANSICLICLIFTCIFRRNMSFLVARDHQTTGLRNDQCGGAMILGKYAIF